MFRLLLNTYSRFVGFLMQWDVYVRVLFNIDLHTTDGTTEIECPPEPGTSDL